jgi:uncharacterized protein
VDIKEQIKILLALQGLDAQIIEHNQQLKALPDQLEEITRDVTQLEEVVAQELSELEQEDKWKREKEEEHEFIETQIARLRKQMQVSTAHRETLALQRQLDSSRKQSGDLEDELLQTLQAVEARRAAIADHEASLTQLKELLAKEDAEIRKKMKKVETVLSKVRAKREAGSTGLEPSVKARYDMIATHRHPSVVEAVDGHCSGCNMALLPQLYNTLFYANSMEFCPMCMRMIYLKSAVFGEEDAPADK